MHVTLILWISLLLSTAVGNPGQEPIKQQIEALVDGQVIWTERSHSEGFDRAIFLGHTQLSDKSKSKVLKFVRFGKDLPFSNLLGSHADFQYYFPDVRMRNRHGTRVLLQGKIDLRVSYILPRFIRIPPDRVVLHKDNMKRLKAALSVTLVNAALISHVTNVGQANFPKKGQVIWVSSKQMYGSQQPLHLFHFAIFLGLADPQHGSTLPDVIIAQIVMDLPLPVLPENRVDFDAYFPTTWWHHPAFAFDGEIDLKIHKIPPAHIRIPDEILQLDPKGVKKLETAMGISPQYYLPPEQSIGRSSTVPVNGHINTEQFDKSGSENGQTPVTGLTRSTSFGSRNGH